MPLPTGPKCSTRVANEALRLTWWGFGISAVTGALLFAVNAVTYYGNTAFRLKMVLLLLAGANMALFHRYTVATVGAWDAAATPPRAARLAGLSSLVLWTAIILLARWIGFTKGYDFSIPEGVDLSAPFTQ